MEQLMMENQYKQHFDTVMKELYEIVYWPRVNIDSTGVRRWMDCDFELETQEQMYRYMIRYTYRHCKFSIKTLWVYEQLHAVIDGLTRGRTRYTKDPNDKWARRKIRFDRETL